jgi:hypothetical protein
LTIEDSLQLAAGSFNSELETTGSFSRKGAKLATKAGHGVVSPGLNTFLAAFADLRETLFRFARDVFGFLLALLSGLRLNSCSKN